MEDKQTTEVRSTDEQVGNTNVRRETVTQSTTTSGVVVAQRIVWFLIGVIVVFLTLRVLLLVLAANQGNFFVDFVYAVGGFFAAPFAGIFGSPSYGKFFFDSASVVAIVVYLLLGWGIAKLLTLNRPKDEV